MTRVDEARAWARLMVERESRGNDKMNALDKVSRSVGLGQRSLYRLITGEMKDPGVETYWRIREGYLGQVQRMIAALQNELQAEMSRAHSADIGSIEDELQSLAEKVKQAKGR